MPGRRAPPRNSRTRAAMLSSMAKRKAAKKKKGEKPLPQRSYMAKAEIGKSIGFKKTNYITMKYASDISMVLSLGNYSGYLFRCNGLYDPDGSGGGHQPYTFDQWKVFYNKYRVVKSRIKVTALTTGGEPIIWGIYTQDDTSGVSSPLDAIESGRGPYSILPSGADTVQTLYCDFETKKFFGPEVDIGETSALVTADPTEQAYFNIWAACLNSTTESPQLDFMAEIDYHVVMMEPKDLPGS